jgi:hypothetical protein
MSGVGRERERREVEGIPGKKYASIKKPAMYEGLKEKGYSKERAAKISNAAAKKSKRRHQTKKSNSKGY